MREILFRGKATNREKGYHKTKYKNNEWVYGIVSRLFDERFENLPAEMTNTDGVSGIDVDYKTIGQYTGLIDKRHKRIFEGDIVKGKDNLERNLEVCGYIDHKNGSFVIIGDLMTHYRWLDYELEVIGNIHDNPELLNPSFKPEYRDGDPDAPICTSCRMPLNEMEDCDCGQKIDWSEE